VVKRYPEGDWGAGPRPMRIGGLSDKPLDQRIRCGFPKGQYPLRLSAYHSPQSSEGQAGDEHAF
jgi:hypothetical protein